MVMHCEILEFKNFDSKQIRCLLIQTRILNEKKDPFGFQTLSLSLREDFYKSFQDFYKSSCAKTQEV